MLFGYNCVIPTYIFHEIEIFYSVSFTYTFMLLLTCAPNFLHFSALDLYFRILKSIYYLVPGFLLNFLPSSQDKRTGISKEICFLFLYTLSIPYIYTYHHTTYWKYSVTQFQNIVNILTFTYDVWGTFFSANKKKKLN